LTIPINENVEQDEENRKDGIGIKGQYVSIGQYESK
jgi:hypothetical protein